MSRPIKKLLIGILAAAMVLSLTGCALGNVQTADLTEGLVRQEVVEKAVDDTFVDSHLDFSVDIFKECVLQNGECNTLVSPLSVKLAFAMVANGADGATKEEMQEILTEDFSIEELNQYLYTYVNSLPNDENNQLSIANSIWYRDSSGVQIEEEFLQNNVNYYDAQVYKSPFDGTTVTDINNWVSNNTDGMIDKAVNDIDAQMVMYLINALTFDAKWEVQYENDQISDDVFTNVNGTESNVKMMYSEEYYYLEDDKATGFIKTYKDNYYSFVALLPKDENPNAIYEYVRGLDSETIKNLFHNQTNGQVNVYIPEFSYDYEVKMSEMFQRMGMKTAFDMETADFSKMGSVDEGNIYMDEVLHKTHIEVDRNGTKAAAITIIGMTGGSMSLDEIYEVRLDRPFVYMIVDNETELPIFMGTMLNMEKDTNEGEEAVYIDHHHQLSEVEQTVENPIDGYCGNTITKLQECNTSREYEFYGTESVTLTDILINMEYKQEEICRCPAEYYVDTEFATGYEINLEQGFVRCENGQAMLTEEQLEKVREVIERLESGDYWHYGT